MCLASRSDAVSSSLQAFFPNLDHVFVCVGCHQACLRDNAAAQLWMDGRDDGLLNNSAQARLLNVMPRRSCSVSSLTDRIGVSRGHCHLCYFRFRPATTPRRASCASTIHGDVSTDRIPSARPGPGILHFLWPDAKAAEQASLPVRNREMVCHACKTLAEQRSRASRPTPLVTSAAAAEATAPVAVDSPVQGGTSSSASPR